MRLESLPGPIPYVSPLEERTAVWKPRLEAIPRPRVGLAWAVFARRDIAYVTRQKTVPLALLAPVIAASSASFVSLQLGAAGNLASHGELAQRIVDFTADIRDFGDTAAIIAELDLVISSDTSVAHVAGVMGKPTSYKEKGKSRFHVDLLAPSKAGTFPIVPVPDLKAYAQRLPHLDDLLADTQNGGAAGARRRRGSSVPAAERFALHSCWFRNCAEAVTPGSTEICTNLRSCSPCSPTSIRGRSRRLPQVCRPLDVAA